MVIIYIKVGWNLFSLKLIYALPHQILIGYIEINKI